ncbi:MAG: SDR family oxidoreductase [Methylococcales bacterium]|nr:SDR family oxidoreductase [Methylococcales bacterium]MCK5924450.1 SDR family oxidoreductase [Methylococcales bacterium]
MHNLKRTILITGASSGIGRKIAEDLLMQGHVVIGISRNCEQFTTYHPNFIFEKLDLGNLSTFPEKAKALVKKYTDIDTIIFAAGYGKFCSLEEFSFAQIEALMNVNFTSQVFLTQAFLPTLKQKKRADLIYIGSEAALQGTQKGTIYCASKFALRGFTQALRQECAKSHLKVSLINPGMVQTAFFAQLNFEAGGKPEQHLRPQDVARAVNYLLNSDPYCVIDELNLTPLHRVVHFKK